MKTSEARHIPFVDSRKDCEFVSGLYSDSSVVRLSLPSGRGLQGLLPSGPVLWLDPALDGLDKKPSSIADGAWREYIKTLPHSDIWFDSARTLNTTQLRALAAAALDECLKLDPGWLSVPQLPLITDDRGARNRTNKQLAKAAADWARTNNYTGRMILPVIVSHQSQINQKTARNPIVAQVSRCLETAGASGVWVVDSTLVDQRGSRTFSNPRFPGLIAFHGELQAALPEATTFIAGPYWGMNLVLWVRGLADYPAIGLGNSYQYFVPGGTRMQARKRVALEPLRRWAIVSPQLRGWLAEVVTSLPRASTSRRAFSQLLAEFDQLQLGDAGRKQVAGFYKDWYERIAKEPPEGRALALYQDLSTAYVTGKPLPNLPAEEKAARKPAVVAQQLMLQCL